MQATAADSSSSELQLVPHPHGEERTGEEAERPVSAPAADRRRGSHVAHASIGQLQKEVGEAMFVREYNRGREVRTTAIQGPEVIAMLTSLVGENQAMSKRKVCLVHQLTYRVSLTCTESQL